MNLFRWTACVGSLVIVAACGETTAPRSSVRVGDIRLTVDASAPEVQRGSAVTLRVTLVNEGAQEMTLHFSDGCQIVSIIRDASGEIVVPFGGSWACVAALTQLTLVPGQPVVRDFVWTGSTAFQSEIPLRPLPSGRYFFSATVPAGEGTLTAGTAIVLK
ncbi:MAG: BsuPI-related putative proteinase inhibitor [Gemmatimonadaceae bacterium]